MFQIVIGVCSRMPLRYYKVHYTPHKRSLKGCDIQNEKDSTDVQSNMFRKTIFVLKMKASVKTIILLQASFQFKNSSRKILLEMITIGRAWSSLVEGAERLDLPSSQTCMECCLASGAYIFGGAGVDINTIAYRFGRYSLHLLLQKSSMGFDISKPHCATFS